MWSVVKGPKLTGAEILKRIEAGKLDPALRGTRRCKPWEVELLALVSEQQAMAFDQLARFLRCEEADAAQIAMYLVHCGYAEYGRLLVGEPPWLWLTEAGNKRSRTGFWTYSLRVGAMPRIRAINEVRLFLARRVPGGEWTCYRALLREQGLNGYRPNGVIKVREECHAVVVRMRSQEDEREIRPLEAHMAIYDAVIVFANPGPRQAIKRLAVDRHWGKVVVRDLPTPESR